MTKDNYLTLSDGELAALAKGGDDEALTVLLNRYKNLITAVARSYFLSGGEMDDLVQEGMIGAFKSINTYNGDSSFKTYLYTCVRNAVMTYIKTSNRKKNIPLNNAISLSGYVDGDTDKNDLFLDKNLGPEDVYINKEAESELNESIKAVLSEYENNILQYYLQGFSYSDIGEKTGKDSKSVDNAIQRIRKKLSKII